jgi:glycosyltransferase involved in cell wall biosynthesis
MENAGTKRVLIFIVAYNAERTIQNVLQRIPAAMAEFDTHILIIDDSSHDRTFERARDFQASGFPITVLVNPLNQGYGGNQKIGFHYAIEEGYDFVVLLHGDGQYAPEQMLDLLRPVSDGAADMVMGSRMLSRGGALAGGMPLYKFFGNKILTFIQNGLLRTDLSGFHPGTASIPHVPCAGFPSTVILTSFTSIQRSSFNFSVGDSASERPLSPLITAMKSAM